MPRLELDGVSLAAAPGEDALAPDATLAFEAGAWQALLARRGGGARAVLDAISGRRALTAGAVRLDGARLDALAPSARPLARVGLALVPYPALRVGAALALPLRRRGVPRTQVRARVREVAASLDLAPYLDRRCGSVPDTVRARVDLARALVRPDLAILLIDALGAGADRFERVRLGDVVRGAMRARDLIVIQATADQREALAVADRVVALADGRVVQTGTPGELYAAPRTTALAASLGDPAMNLLPCVLRGKWIVVAGARLLHPPAERLAGDDPVVVGVRPEDVRVGAVEGDAALAAELLRVEDRGRRRLAVFAAGEATVQADASAADDLVVGHRYGLTLAPDGIRLYRAGVLVDG